MHFVFQIDFTHTTHIMSFPKSEERQKCWAARDQYWQCLEKNDEDKTKCTTQRTQFENSCVKQWVSMTMDHSYFVIR